MTATNSTELYVDLTRRGGEGGVDWDSDLEEAEEEDDINVNGFTADHVFFVTGSLGGVEDGERRLVPLKPVSSHTFFS